MRSEGDDDAIDAAIAEAVRSVTAGEPSAALRAGVRDRIGRRRVVWWLAPIAATAAVIVVALVLGRLTSSPSEGPLARLKPQPPALVVAPRVVRQPVSDVRTVATGMLAPRRRLVATFEPPLEELEPAIPPLTIAPLETTLIAVDTSSGVMPIEIEPLQIEPLRGE